MNPLKKIKFTICFFAIFPLYTVCAQETFPKNDVADERVNAVALTHATITIDPFTILEDATLLLHDGRVESVSKNSDVPKGYREMDLAGHYIYPSFIEMFSNYGQPKVTKPPRGNPYVKREQVQSKTKGAYNPNEAIKSFYNSADYFFIDDKEAAKMRGQGFGTASIFRPDGIARGTAALVTLGKGTENNMVISPVVASHYSFDKGSSTQDYPISPMGSIALLRQTFYDSQWYALQTKRPFTDLSLNALIANRELPQIFEADGWLTALRADRMGKEIGLDFIIKGGGDEYQRIQEIKQMNAPLIVPLNFPLPFDVSDPFITQKIALDDLKHWELAPTNPAQLEQNGITFAITSHPADNLGGFLANLRKSVTYGLSKEQALSSLTSVPAKLLGIDDIVGTLKKGQLANFLVADGDIFHENTILLENWVKGERHIVNKPPATAILGAYHLEVGNITAELEIKIKNSKQVASVLLPNGNEHKVSVKLNGDMIFLEFETDNENKYTLAGWTDPSAADFTIKGEGTIDFKDSVFWKAVREKESDSKGSAVKKRPSGKLTATLGETIFPFMAYGTTDKIRPQSVLITNATVWTNEEEGILENTDVLIQDGKIVRIGKNIEAGNARIIEGAGKHLTPGIIDEHSHIAISAVNEIAANSSMVRMGDVINSEDISIYRALAGGVVAAHILHGSSDPIGGQSALIKLKWGEDPETLKIEGAAPFIKFALGENPKRSKSAPSIRFPRSLMGLEQFYTNAFSEALDYKKGWDGYNQLDKRKRKSTPMPRTDLVKQAMLEIVEGRRYISCHSYQEKEMLMLMDVAKRFGFTINTFTHALEGYRIADKLVEHGIGGSTFSDKWNFKWETRNAIPYNATIMNNEGVVTAINSDSRETIRHLNHEAAKSIKYGNMAPEEALKLITLNPAKLLRLDETMGSIKVGKSADVVLWSAPPMSIYAKPEKTIIEGAIYFDLERDKILREENVRERARIIQLMQGDKTRKTAERKISPIKPEFHCESLGMEQ
ncbi:Imidazolonepropionase [Flagellimonas pacifica]|uniref:Imidazolonepropionase n=2 Tax=Flagellimonas pacifica TaxID=1247520 RepID=A0A285MVY1_9FLAO|nr:Imidazolonepropionase [Allomuricauda parva]